MSFSASDRDRRRGSGLSGQPHSVTWDRPQGRAYVPPPVPQAKANGIGASPIVVALLSIACSVLAIFDLLLLASGTS
jgi:hypothetical protein